MRLDSVYVTYWSLLDPLCQSQSLPYLRSLVARGYRLGLVTFEQENWSMGKSRRESTREALRAEGIEWRPLTYHKSPAVLSTLYDIGVGALATASLAHRSGAPLIHGRASVAGAIASIAARLARTKLFVDADGPLSEEYVDVGLWKEGSLAHRLTAWGERRSLEMADAVAVLTEHRRKQVELLIPDTPIQVLPCAVDTDAFRRSSERRAAVRTELGLHGTVFVYAGKTEGWYDILGMTDFVEVAARKLKDVSFLVLTADDPTLFVELGHRAGITVIVRLAPFQEVPFYLSAADVGLCFLQKHRTGASCSPIKIGEYLACGLPVAISTGCGHYDDIVRQESVGVVRAAPGAKDDVEAVEALIDLLADEDISQRCRDAAKRFVGLDEIVAPRYADIYGALVGRRP